MVYSDLALKARHHLSWIGLKITSVGCTHLGIFWIMNICLKITFLTSIQEMTYKKDQYGNGTKKILNFCRFQIYLETIVL
jgi:hypothetical protein